MIIQRSCCSLLISQSSPSLFFFRAVLASASASPSTRPPPTHPFYQTSNYSISGRRERWQRHEDEMRMLEEIQRQEEESKRIPVIVEDSQLNDKEQVQLPLVEWDEHGELRILRHDTEDLGKIRRQKEEKKKTSNDDHADDEMAQIGAGNNSDNAAAAVTDDNKKSSSKEGPF